MSAAVRGGARRVRPPLDPLVISACFASGPAELWFVVDALDRASNSPSKDDDKFAIPVYITGSSPYIGNSRTSFGVIVISV